MVRLSHTHRTRNDPFVKCYQSPTMMDSKREKVSIRNLLVPLNGCGIEMGGVGD